MSEFSILDFVVLCIILFSSVIGAYNGFVRSFLGLVGWVVSIYYSMRLFPIVESFLQSKFKSQLTIYLIGYVSVFLLLLFLCALIKILLSDLLRKVIPAKVDKTLGLFFGCAKVSVFIFGAMYCAGIILSHFNGLAIEDPKNWPKTIADSKIMEVFAHYSIAVNHFLPENVQKKLAALEQKDNSNADAEVNAVLNLVANSGATKTKETDDDNKD